MQRKVSCHTSRLFVKSEGEEGPPRAAGKLSRLYVFGRKESEYIDQQVAFIAVLVWSEGEEELRSAGKNLSLFGQRERNDQ